MTTATIPSPLGDLTLAANSTHLTGIYFAGCAHVPDQTGWTHDPQHPILRQAAAELAEYFAGKRTTFTIPLHPVGTAFQESIWREIARVPYGETITYSELAERAGRPAAIRAAGASTGRNPLSIIIPCHRIVGKDRALRGFAGGLDRKQRLLALEQEFSSSPAAAR